jgi:hypothetical protein
MSTKKATAAAQHTTDVAMEKPAISAIVSTVPRALRQVNAKDPAKLSPKERGLAGRYRVIHGTIHVTRPTASFTRPDGTEIPFAPKWDEAGIHLQADGKYLGDVVDLTDEDAAVLVDSDQVEPLDAKPSRVGKVFNPPKVVREFGGMPQGVPDGASASR